MRPVSSLCAFVVAVLLGVGAVGCGGAGEAGDATGAAGSGAASSASDTGSSGADGVDPSGTTLTADEIAAGAAWDDAGTEENGELDESDEDGTLADDVIGDETAEFDALPLATADDDALSDDADGGAALVTTQDLGEGFTLDALVKSSGPLVCTPPGQVRSAACYAHAKYRGQIHVVTMDSKIVEVSVACAVLNGKSLARSAGRTLTVNSGWRSVASQRVLYQKYKAGRGPVAAPPGTSHHNCGHAIDYAGSALGSGWLKANSTRFGFHFIPIKGETWHFEDWGVGPAGVK